MKTKHTRGPWLVEKPVYKQNNVAYVILPANNSEQSTQGQAIARINASIDSEQETHLANANLIAAAPELLATLQALVAHGVCRILSSEDAQQLEELIAKAKGEGDENE